MIALNFIKRLVEITNSKNKEDDTVDVILAPSYLQADYKSRFVMGCLLVSLGILLSASGGSWDVTNHLLNKPETFFALPHAVLYTGIALALLGSAIMFHGWRCSANYYPELHRPVELVFAGILTLLVAGPVDFAWHSAFGLDGLLSPPHFVLLMGMTMSSVGAMLGTIKCRNNDKNNISNIKDKPPSVMTGLNKSNYYSRSTLLTIIGMLPIWLVASGIVGMFTLPFSNTKYFAFNPEPSLAVIFATMGYPFVISIILFSSFGLTRRFGIVSITGGVYLIINVLTVIMPNESLLPTLPFYIINIIPMIVADVILSISTKKLYYVFIAGALLGAPFFMLQYPLITYTYNELLTKQPVWPSLTVSIYFGMIKYVYPLVVIPAMTMGMLGIVVGDRLIRRVMPSLTSVL
jgi:hypothetical protein